VRDVLDRLVPWLEKMSSLPLSELDGSRKLARSLRRPFPERGAPWSDVLRTLDRALGRSLNTTSPGYLAFVPGGGLPDVAVADLYADLVNRFTGLWMPAPGFVSLEMEVLRWLCQLVGYGEEAGGLLVSGGSLANLGAVVAARHDKLPEMFLDGVAYGTGQVHHSMTKALIVAGFPPRAWHTVPTDRQHRLDPEALLRALEQDRAQGRRPCLVVANAGSTAVGAVDDLQALAEICAQQGLWLHVDGAYGGFFPLTERGRAALRGLQRADSITLDPHKGMFLPYGTGCLLVRRRETLRQAHAVEASYLPAPQTEADAWDFADYGPELSRPNRGLRLWLPLVLHGFGAFREALDEKMDLARAAADQIRKMPHVRMISEPVLSLFAFRAEPPGLDPAQTDALNRKWMAKTNQQQRVFLSGARIWDPELGYEVFVVRVCVLCFRTHEDRIEMLLEDLAKAWEVTCGSGSR
jgi:aromatic-L-amino-acid decarboxylase